MPEGIQNTSTSVVEAHFLCSVSKAIGKASIDDIVKIQRHLTVMANLLIDHHYNSA